MASGTAVSEWITTGAAVAAVLGAAVTILQSRRTARRTLTYQYIARFHDPEFIDVMTTSSLFLRCRDKPPAVAEADWEAMDEPDRQKTQLVEWSRLSASPAENDRQKALKIVALPNLLEDMAGMYNHDLLDRRIVKTHVQPVVESVWGKASWWFDAMRRDPDTNVYQELAKMVPDLELRKRPRWHRPRDGRITRGVTS